MQIPIIAIDVGHSATKVLAQTGELRHQILFPSVVTPAIEIDEPRARAAADAETLTVAGTRYFYGRTAVVQGRAESESQLTDDWLSSSVYATLLGATVQELRRRMVPLDRDAIVLGGLPARLFSAQSELLERLMRAHFPHARLFVLPQPLAPYFAVRFKDDGSPSEQAPGAYAVVDAGAYTVDCALVQDDQWIQHGSGSAPGAYVAAEHLAKALSKRFSFQVSPLACHQVLATGEFRAHGRPHAIHAELEAAKRVFGDTVLAYVDRKFEREAPSLEAILLVGGAAPLLEARMRQRWPNLLAVPNPRFVVAEGMLRAGLAARAAASEPVREAPIARAA
jgi:plasmid segregation protein ParM